LTEALYIEFQNGEVRTDAGLKASDAIDVEPRGSPDIAEKSNEIPAAQTLLVELGIAGGAIVTLNAMQCQRNISRPPHKPASL